MEVPDLRWGFHRACALRSRPPFFGNTFAPAAPKEFDPRAGFKPALCCLPDVCGSRTGPMLCPFSTNRPFSFKVGAKLCHASSKAWRRGSNRSHHPHRPPRARCARERRCRCPFSPSHGRLQTCANARRAFSWQKFGCLERLTLPEPSKAQRPNGSCLGQRPPAISSPALGHCGSKLQ